MSSIILYCWEQCYIQFVTQLEIQACSAVTTFLTPSDPLCPAYSLSLISLKSITPSSTNTHCPILCFYYFSPRRCQKSLNNHPVLFTPFKSIYPIFLIILQPKLKYVSFTPLLKHFSSRFQSFSTGYKAIHEPASIYPDILTNKLIPCLRYTGQ